MKIKFANPISLEQVIQEELELVLERKRRRKGFGKFLKKTAKAAKKAAKTAKKKAVQLHRAIGKQYKSLNKESQAKVCETIAEAGQSENPEQAVNEVLEMLGYDPLNLEQTIGLEIGIGALAMLMRSIDPEGMKRAEIAVAKTKIMPPDGTEAETQEPEEPAAASPSEEPA